MPRKTRPVKYVAQIKEWRLHNLLGDGYFVTRFRPISAENDKEAKLKAVTNENVLKTEVLAIFKRIK